MELPGELDFGLGLQFRDLSRCFCPAGKIALAGKARDDIFLDIGRRLRAKGRFEEGPF